MFHTQFDRRPAADTTSGAPFRVLQLNTQAHWSVDDESTEAFEARTALHKGHIAHVQPTIVVLQEVDGPATLPPGTASLPSQLQAEGYDGVFGAKHNEKGDQTWILFRTSHVKLVSHDTLRFSPEESQFALMARLNFLPSSGACCSNSELLVVAQHAKAGRTQEHEGTRIRHSQALIEHLTTSPLTKPYVDAGRALLVGDFNAGPHSYEGKYPDAWYHQVVIGSLRPLGFDSAYRAWSGADRAVDGSAATEPPFTTVKWRKGSLISQCIDYLFFQPAGLTLVGVLALPHSGSIPPGGLPAANLWGSDHLSIGCEFTMSEVSILPGNVD